MYMYDKLYYSKFNFFVKINQTILHTRLLFNNFHILCCIVIDNYTTLDLLVKRAQIENR